MSRFAVVFVLYLRNFRSGSPFEPAGPELRDSSRSSAIGRLDARDHTISYDRLWRRSHDAAILDSVESNGWSNSSRIRIAEATTCSKHRPSSITTRGSATDGQSW